MKTKYKILILIVTLILSFLVGNHLMEGENYLVKFIVGFIINIFSMVAIIILYNFYVFFKK